MSFPDKQVLNIVDKELVVKIAFTSTPGTKTVSEELGALVGVTPNLTIDMSGVDLDPISIGTLANIQRIFNARWGNRKLSLKNVTKKSASVIAASKLGEKCAIHFADPSVKNTENLTAEKR